MPRRQGRAARVHQHETAGAIGALDVTGLKTALADGRSLLITRHATDGNGAAKQSWIRHAERSAAGAHLGQQAVGNLIQSQQFGVPIQLVDIEQPRATGVGVIGGMHLATREAPDQKTIHGAESQIPRLGVTPGTVHVVQQPGHLAGGEIGIQQQSGAALHLLLQPVAAHALARFCRAPILPDDGVVNGGTAGPVPHHAGLPLVGQTDGRHLVPAALGNGQRLPGHLQRRRPDSLRVVLHPAIGRIDLGKLLLSHMNNARPGVEGDGAAAGGALIQGEYTRFGHGL